MSGKIISISDDEAAYFVVLADESVVEISKNDITEKQLAQLKAYEEEGGVVQRDNTNRKERIVESMLGLHTQALALEREILQNPEAPEAVVARLAEVNARLEKIRAQVKRGA